MAFSEASANYQLYLKTLGSLSGPEALEYERHFVQYLIAQADATGTINSSTPAAGSIFSGTASRTTIAAVAAPVRAGRKRQVARKLPRPERSKNPTAPSISASP